MTGIIVVGVDGSETAQMAAEAASDIALALGTSLHVVTAFDNDRTEVFGTGSDRKIVSGADDAEEIARNSAASLNAQNLRIEYFAVKGSPAQALVKQAETYRARMIVVGNKRMQGLGRVLGNVASHVAHHAPCDVLIAKTDDIPSSKREGRQ
ncbi:universal stress protein [Arthrobacter sp. EpRS71]|uniref:universal stress protein n=1 Tax=Arthrobacter sp. EpRS71 TaxID=1743141 RepID=UPI000746FFC0|nr:universal stress protein [Arthrobacter sp. EpRS71]KUM36350.1 universal stress protein UspA [Arthrobacter sp. EpRS71]